MADDKNENLNACPFPYLMLLLDSRSSVRGIVLYSNPELYKKNEKQHLNLPDDLESKRLCKQYRKICNTTIPVVILESKSHSQESLHFDEINSRFEVDVFETLFDIAFPAVVIATLIAIILHRYLPFDR